MNAYVMQSNYLPNGYFVSIDNYKTPWLWYLQSYGGERLNKLLPAN